MRALDPSLCWARRRWPTATSSRRRASSSGWWRRPGTRRTRCRSCSPRTGRAHRRHRARPRHHRDRPPGRRARPVPRVAAQARRPRPRHGGATGHGPELPTSPPWPPPTSPIARSASNRCATLCGGSARRRARARSSRTCTPTSTARYGLPRSYPCALSWSTCGGSARPGEARAGPRPPCPPRPRPGTPRAARTPPRRSRPSTARTTAPAWPP